MTVHLWAQAVEKGNAWIEELGDELGWRDPHAVLGALRAVLHAVRDRLPSDEAAELAAQMPLLVKGIYFDGWDPSAAPAKARTRDAFLALVRGHLGGRAREADTEQIIRAVFKLLAEHVSEGEIHDVRGALPAELADLWPVAAGTRAWEGVRESGKQQTPG